MGVGGRGGGGGRGVWLHGDEDGGWKVPVPDVVHQERDSGGGGLKGGAKEEEADQFVGRGTVELGGDVGEQVAEGD